jgi:hypothetical protein
MGGANANEPFGNFQLRNLPPWRRTAIAITNHWAFVGIVNAAILFAAAQLAWPYVQFPSAFMDKNIGSRFNAKLTINTASDGVVLFIFMFEAAFKIIAFGSGLDLKGCFRRKDTNDQEEASDNQDSESEVRSHMDKLRPEEDAAIRDIFDLFDVDHSGTMNQVELRLAMRGLGFDESSESLKRLFDEMDSDGNQEIDFEEFKEVMAAKIFSQRPPPGYFNLRWNRFDFCSLLISMAVFPIQFFLDDAKRVGDIARLIRLARLWAVLQARALRGLHDVVRVASLSLRTSIPIFALIASVLVLYAVMGVSLFSDGSYHGRCVTADDSKSLARWTTSFSHAAAVSAAPGGRPPPLGALQLPPQHCGDTACESPGFRCACFTDTDGSGTLSDGPAPAKAEGCRRIPVAPFGAVSGDRPVTDDYGFTGFDNVMQGFLTAYISMTQAR